MNNAKIYYTMQVWPTLGLAMCLSAIVLPPREFKKTSNNHIKGTASLPTMSYFPHQRLTW